MTPHSLFHYHFSPVHTIDIQNPFSFRCNIWYSFIRPPSFNSHCICKKNHNPGDISLSHFNPVYFFLQSTFCIESELLCVERFFSSDFKLQNFPPANPIRYNPPQSTGKLAPGKKSTLLYSPKVAFEEVAAPFALTEPPARGGGKGEGFVIFGTPGKRASTFYSQNWLQLTAPPPGGGRRQIPSANVFRPAGLIIINHNPARKIIHSYCMPTVI